MTDYSRMPDEQINEEIFKAKGWVKLPPPAAPPWQRATEQGMELWYYEDPPDYTHEWQFCGELLQEIDNFSLRRFGNIWKCGWLDEDDYLVELLGQYDNPMRAICEAWLTWGKRKYEQ